MALVIEIYRTALTWPARDDFSIWAFCAFIAATQVAVASVAAGCFISGIVRSLRGK